MRDVSICTRRRASYIGMDVLGNRIDQGCIVTKEGGTRGWNASVKRASMHTYAPVYIPACIYTVILARIILKQGVGGVGSVNRIKARANDVESFLITPRKPAWLVWPARADRRAKFYRNTAGTEGARDRNGVEIPEFSRTRRNDVTTTLQSLATNKTRLRRRTRV